MIVRACPGDGTGGSPTVVLPDDGRRGDAERCGCRVPVEHGTPHAVLVGAGTPPPTL
ncbi:hypothetical protein [Streptomyces sp. NPDC101132]|uniref:hypothetical protein n=1 Tax=Streptomyces sp. NPDC101132 TaxID=3366110 RepID=UPI00381A2803